jgi:cell fate regulator YaaT (PSP1 superfamily)
MVVIGVRFKKLGKVYYFDPKDTDAKKGDNVIVETVKGLEYGEVVIDPKTIKESDMASPIKSVIRKASEEDYRKIKENKHKECRAMSICSKKIAEYNLSMNLVNVRDEARMIGGLGPCGRQMCCGAFLGDFDPVSIKMAKEQCLSLNPTKISGVCGRLMCCLKYEQSCYEEIRSRMPKLNKEVTTPKGKGIVSEINILGEKVKVRFQTDDGTAEILEFPLSSLQFQRTGTNGNGEQDESFEIDEEINLLLER